MTEENLNEFTFASREKIKGVSNLRRKAHANPKPTALALEQTQIFHFQIYAL